MNASLLAACLLGIGTWCAMKPTIRRGSALQIARSRLASFVARTRQAVTPTPTSYSREVATLASGLAAELRAGRAPQDAWERVTSKTVSVLPGRSVPGADVVSVLRGWARRPGWSGFDALAVCWGLAGSTGSGLADALDKVGEAMRHEHEIALEVNGQLAVTRATTIVLATLPVLVVAMGGVVGADLVAVLFGTSLGLGCLILGLSLSAAGAWWIARQSARVRRILRW